MQLKKISVEAEPNANFPSRLYGRPRIIRYSYHSRRHFNLM